MITELDKKTIREVAELTTSYVCSDEILIQGATQVNLMCDFVKGYSDRAELKLEFSEDVENWYQEGMFSQVIIGGEGIEYGPLHVPVVRKILSTGKIVLSLPVSYSWMRIWVKAVGDSDGASLGIIGVFNRI